MSDLVDRIIQTEADTVAALQRINDTSVEMTQLERQVREAEVLLAHTRAAKNAYSLRGVQSNLSHALTRRSTHSEQLETKFAQSQVIVLRLVATCQETLIAFTTMMKQLKYPSFSRVVQEVRSLATSPMGGSGKALALDPILARPIDEILAAHKHLMETVPVPADIPVMLGVFEKMFAVVSKLYSQLPMSKLRRRLSSMSSGKAQGTGTPATKSPAGSVVSLARPKLEAISGNAHMGAGIFLLDDSDDERPISSTRLRSAIAESDHSFL